MLVVRRRAPPTIIVAVSIIVVGPALFYLVGGPVPGKETREGGLGSTL